MSSSFRLISSSFSMMGGIGGGHAAAARVHTGFSMGSGKGKSSTGGGIPADA